jgi:hypothetical protein
MLNRRQFLAADSSSLALANQCRRKAESEGLVSLMNDTKWKELCFAFSNFPQRPAWRTRDLLNGYLSAWDSEWSYHVGPDYCTIEWLQVDPKDCERASIHTVLSQVGAPFDESIPYFKVYGYRK